MARPQPIPFDDERLLQLREEQEEALRSEQWVESLHIGTTAILCTASLWIALWDRGELGAGLALGLGFLCLIGMLVCRSISLLLGDLYRQFQYREKFALFLLHCCLFLAPYFLLGVRDWTVCFGVLLVILSFETIDRMWFGRVQALCVWLVLQAAFSASGETAPPGSLVALWSFLLLLALRFYHVRFRLEQEGQRRGVALGLLLRRSAAACLIPPLLGYAAWFLADRYLQPRTFTIVLEPAAVGAGEMALTLPQLFWRGLAIMAVILLCLAALSWLEKKLRRKKSSIPEVEGDLAATEQRVARAREFDELLKREEVTGARRRVIAALADFSRALETAGLARREAETVAEFLARLDALQPEQGRLAAQAAEPFHVACYDQRAMTDKEADAFEDLLRRHLPRLQEISAPKPGS